MYQPQSIGHTHRQCATAGRCTGDTLRDERSVNVMHGPVPDPRADLRLRTVSRHRQRRAIGRMNSHRVPRLRVAFDVVDAAGEYPRMPPLQRFLAAGLEYQFMHESFIC